MVIVVAFVMVVVPVVVVCRKGWSLACGSVWGSGKPPGKTAEADTNKKARTLAFLMSQELPPRSLEVMTNVGKRSSRACG